MFDAPLTLADYKAQLISIPAGSFEREGFTITLSPFQMGRTPVTVGMWQEFCQATGKSMPELLDYPVWKNGWDAVRDHPMVCVSWYDCTAYARWAGLVLPSAAQWEFAARGGLVDKLYPWGDEGPREQLWWLETSNDVGTAPVQRTHHVFVNGYGLVDMAGNVWEWCEDGVERDRYRFVCGVSWYDGNAYGVCCAHREENAPAFRYRDVGFRLCSR